MLSVGDWVALLALAGSVVGFAWRFSLRVVRELGEMRTDLLQVKLICKKIIIPRLQNVEEANEKKRT